MQGTLLTVDTTINKAIALTITKTSNIFIFALSCCLDTNTNWNYLIALNILL